LHNKELLTEEKVQVLLGPAGEHGTGDGESQGTSPEGIVLSEESNSSSLMATIQELSATVSGLTTRIRVLEEQLDRLRSGMEESKGKTAASVQPSKAAEEERPSHSLWESIRAHALADRPRNSYVWTTPIVKAGSRSNGTAKRTTDSHSPKTASPESSPIPSLPSRAEKYRSKK
jgi:uncharacterized coiled-coil protein SlyX